jgi:anti-anti-sigma factor
MNQLIDISGTSALTETLGAGTFAQRPVGELARFTAECRGTVCLLHVSGEVDISNSAELDAAIAGISQEHSRLVLVSFVDCIFADCSCLGVVVRQFERLAARLLIIAPPASGLGRILDMASLTTRLPVHDSVRQALLAIVSGPGAALGELSTWKSLDTTGDHRLAKLSALQVTGKSEDTPCAATARRSVQPFRAQGAASGSPAA